MRQFCVLRALCVHEHSVVLVTLYRKDCYCARSAREEYDTGKL